MLTFNSIQFLSITARNFIWFPLFGMSLYLDSYSLNAIRKVYVSRIMLDLLSVFHRVYELKKQVESTIIY